MAALERIRQKGPLLAIVIGFALFAFIFTDLFSNIDTLFGDSANTVAKIEGSEVGIDEFQARFNTVKEIYEYLGNTVDSKLQESIEGQVWEQIVQDRLLTDVYADHGIAVSEEEMAALITGQNMDVDPTVKQIFSNRQTGEFIQDAAVEFFKTVDQDPAKKRFGLYLENEMELNRKFSKYSTLIRQGLNVTDFEAEQLYTERLHMVDFDYVEKKYASVPDSTIAVSDAEMKAYYSAHKNEYKQKESRSIEYVTFDIIPSEKDKKDALDGINDYAEDFKTMVADSANSNVVNYVSANSDNRALPVYYSVDQMQMLGLDSAFFSAPVGTTVGPMEINGEYRIYRSLNKQSVSDTVEARHILIRADGQKILDIATAQKVADSLVTLIKGGKDFGELAKIHGTDATAEKGGDLGKFTQGQMVPEFDKACFFGKVNQVTTVETQFGIHVLEVTYQSPKSEKVQIASFVKNIDVVDATDKLFQQTQIFAGENNTLEKFRAAIEKDGLTKKIASDIMPQTKVVAGFQDASQIISWVFQKETKPGMVCQKEIKIGSQYVIIALTDIKEEGIAKLEQAKDAVKAGVIKEKKGETFSSQLKSELAAGKSFADIATAVSGETNTAKNKSFTGTRIQGAGDEQAVVATAVSMAKDATSEPIVGESGVFLIKVTSVTGVEGTEAEKIANDKTQASSRLTTRSRSAYTALKEASDIVDRRHLVF